MYIMYDAGNKCICVEVITYFTAVVRVRCPHYYCAPIIIVSYN